MNNSTDIFIQVSQSFYKLDDIISFKKKLSPYQNEVNSWVQHFLDDIYSSRKGYPIHKVYEEPLLEYQLLEIIEKTDPSLKKLNRKPTIILTHDIDYTDLTFQLFFKTFVGRKKWLDPFRKVDFVDSVSRYLEFERNLLGQSKTSTLFIPAPVAPSKLKEKFIHKVIDPSFDISSPELENLRTVINNYEPNIGLHGSYFSLANNSHLELEKQKLEKALNRTITTGRQHWLNLPNKNSLGVIRKSGIKTDFTLGWNGVVGFRGGLSRPFSLSFDGNQLLMVPLLLMDGVLFDELKMNSSEVVNKSKKMLELVFEQKGCVAINWHGRTHSNFYNWGQSYEVLVKWAKDKGFAFNNWNSI